MSLAHFLSSPAEIASTIGKQAKALRLSRNLTRRTLAERSGVPESSIKRFELSGSVSLEAVILLATALDELTPVTQLFQASRPRSYDELKNIGRRRGSL